MVHPLPPKRDSLSWGCRQMATRTDPVTLATGDASVAETISKGGGTVGSDRTGECRRPLWVADAFCGGRICRLGASGHLKHWDGSRPGPA
jgi:hypothetical protein